MTAPEEDLHDLHRRLVALLGVAGDLRLEREIVIEQALTPLRLFRQAKADLHLAVGQREAAAGAAGSPAQAHLAEHGARMFHEVAPHLIEAIANAMRLAVARGEEQPGVLEPPQASTTVRAHREALPAQRRDAERLDPVAGLVEVYVREIRVDENARASPAPAPADTRAEAHRRRRPQRNRRRQAIVVEQAVFVIAHPFLVAPIVNHCLPGRRSISAALG